MNQPNPGIIRKSAARLAAVQALYCNQINDLNKNAEELLEEFLKLYHPKQENKPNAGHEEIDDLGLQPDIRYLKKLVVNISLRQEKLDSIIEDHLLDSWSLERIGTVLHVILQAGIYEILYTETPVKVVINEYIEVARAFFDEKDVKFINGVLHNVSQQKS